MSGAGNSVLDSNGECIIWTGCVSSRGYGQFRYKDPRDPPSAEHRNKTAHRVALMVAFKNFNVPSSQQASHLCDKKRYVQHLVFESNRSNNLRKSCFEHHRCVGHYDNAGNKLPDCLLHLSSK